MTCPTCEKNKEKVREAIRLLSADVDDWHGAMDLLWEILGKGKSQLHYLMKDAKAVNVTDLMKTMGGDNKRKTCSYCRYTYGTTALGCLKYADLGRPYEVEKMKNAMTNFNCEEFKPKEPTCTCLTGGPDYCEVHAA